jgi:serine phosphatase RsbU (regulator of sigma subunit)
LVIYTDGISESASPDGAEFGSASLAKLLGTCHQLPSRELVDKCLKEVLNFRSGSPRLDDQALMVLQFQPTA